MVDPENVKEIFARYARLRQSRTSREEAWKRVKPDTDQLIEVERKRVMALIRDWEIIEGHRYKTTRSDDPHATMYKPPPGLREARERLKEQRAFQEHLKAEDVDLDETKEVVLKQQRRPTPPPIKPESIECPQCQHRNPPGVTICVNCGANLSRTRDVTGEAQHFSFMPDTPGESPSLREMALRLEFIESGEVLRVPLTLEQMVLGRAAAGGLMPPDINLAAYDAHKKGVSRYHASLQRRGETLLLTDLQSLNHTFINGQRVFPHEVRVLKDGDELRLGQLTMHVHILKL
jgi:hypothetical protein